METEKLVVNNYGIGTSPSKPGWKTSEFWLSVASFVVYYVLASGALSSTSTAVQILTFVATILTSLGYTASRTLVKRG